MTKQDCLRILEKTSKPIYYKQGRHSIRQQVNSKEKAVKLFLNCVAGGLVEEDDCIVILDYDELDWLS